MRFDLTDLNLFRHVVEAGSITGGAARAHLALAAASTRIRNMEEALGAALLVRGRQGVTPTQAGRTLLQHARAILRQAERLREDLGAYAGGLAGQIRVLSNTNALTEFLPEALSSFLSTHPNVSVDLEERLREQVVGLIPEGVADLATGARSGSGTGSSVLSLKASPPSASSLPPSIRARCRPFPSAKTVSCWSSRATIRSPSARRSRSRMCSTTTSSGWIAP